jgi:hypothetical protein
MNNLFRGLIAGLGAWKLGGGCLGTIVVCSSLDYTWAMQLKQLKTEKN